MKKLKAEKSYLYIKLSSLIRTSKIAIIVGAGISTSCGIPDFRSKTGLFSNDSKILGLSIEQIFSRPVVNLFKPAEDTLYSILLSLKDSSSKATPSKTHFLLYLLQKKFKATIYTQNIDGLEDKAGIKPIYLHGNLNTLICSKCSTTEDYTLELYKEIRNNIRYCIKCTNHCNIRINNGNRRTPIGKMLPSIILYGDYSDSIPVIKQIRNDNNIKVLIVMGTSLKVYGVKNLLKSLSKYSVVNEGVRVYVGLESPPSSVKHYFDYWIESTCDAFSTSLEDALNGGFILREVKNNLDDLTMSLRRLSLEPSFIK